MREDNPLVSIIVITYNSAKFVLETLESAKAQSYQNIELIVSDDCSQDNTVEVCKNWIEENEGRFVRTELITVEKNSGIPANCNRGVKASKGEWVKLIAGDDVLMEECIESFVKFINSDKSIYLVESISQFFRKENSKFILLNQQDFGKSFFFNKSITPKQQYEVLLRKNIIHAPSTFINRKIINEVGEFDERFRFMEDHPMWLKLTKAGYKFHFLDKETVYYRLHNDSVFASKSNNKIYNDFYIKRISADEEYIYPNIHKLEVIFIKLEVKRKKFIDKLGFNKDNFFFKSINVISYRMSPIFYIRHYMVSKIKKEIVK